MGLLDCRTVFKYDREYNLAMDSRQLKYNPNPPKNISNKILTLDQRAILLGTVIAIDFIILASANSSPSNVSNMSNMNNNNATAIGIANGIIWEMYQIEANILYQIKPFTFSLTCSVYFHSVKADNALYSL